MFLVKRLADGRRLIVVFKPQDYPDALRIALGAMRASCRKAWRKALMARVAILDLGLRPASRLDVYRAASARRIVGRRSSVNQLKSLLPLAGIYVHGWRESHVGAGQELKGLVRFVSGQQSIRRVYFEGRAPWEAGRIATDSVALPSLAGDGSVSPSSPIGVFVHIYYSELARETREEIMRIPYPVCIYISTDTVEKENKIREVFPEAVIKVVPNAGRDLGAKIVAFRTEHALHEVVFHTHAKRSYADGSGQGSRAWHDHNVSCLLSSPQRITQAMTFLVSSEEAVVLAPRPWSPVKQTANWASNRALADVLTARWGWPELPDDRDLAFPVGSEFWAQSRALAPLLRARLDVTDLGEERGQRDGTVAHVLERLIGVSCALAGGKLYYMAPGDMSYRV